MNYRYLTPHQANTVHAWHKALQPQGINIPMEPAPETSETKKLSRPFLFDRGHRARLRRAASLVELEAESACFDLRDRLGEMQSSWLDAHDEAWLCLVAGAVANVESDTLENRSLALALGRSSALDNASPMSEMRFRRLLKGQDREAFFRQLRRAMQLARGTVNAARLADDLLGWCAEREFPQPSANAMHYRWARDYYLDRKDQKLTGHNSASQQTATEFEETTA